MQYDVFISYSSQDQKVVECICGYLEARGVRCFVAYRDIPRGVVWARAIVEALESSSMMVVVFSDSFNASEQVEREIELASEDHKPILTFRLSDSKFEGAKKYYLKNLNWIDAFPNPDLAFGDLYDNVCRLLDIEKSSNSGNQSSIGNTTSTYDTSSPSRPSSVSNSSSTSSTSSRSNLTNSYSNEGKSQPNVINGHEYVDLGLPSGLKWAAYNVNAKKPEMYGGYFAWGETEEKMTNLKEDTASYDKDKGALKTDGIIDNKGVLSPSHDVARLKWGSPWRTPTIEDIQELLNNTIRKYTIRKGINGLLFTSKINGKELFLPAVGWQEGLSIKSEGKDGCYWSSTPDENDPLCAGSLSFCSSKIKTDWRPRHLGFAVRPVTL